MHSIRPFFVVMKGASLDISMGTKHYDLPGMQSPRTQTSRNSLCRLPDELGLQIIMSLNVVDIQLLKRTCRHLMRLCGDYTLDSKYATSDSTGLKDYRRLMTIENMQLSEILRRDKVCSGCKGLRADPKRYHDAWHKAERMIWCSGCRCWHPAFLYSWSERDKPFNTRVCIGRQGRIRLCEHETFSWADMQQTKDGLKCRVHCRRGGHKTAAPALMQGRLQHIKSPSAARWLDMLDPRSYLSSQDELTRGIMWCDDPDCPTSSRGRARHDIFYGKFDDEAPKIWHAPLASDERWSPRDKKPKSRRFDPNPPKVLQRKERNGGGFYLDPRSRQVDQATRR
ncbi:hypothetical protein BJ170DRAFT_96029 [Xylariales sp. AK1849]|nr:hypothetical protein BJ170DRAFT_96029 [Xylariales sp. AK1849]